ncbi:flagellar biosynthetic protein FliR [Roseobacter sp. YSTF-M11]|uniref:Flagellar biosynthetic protein FliR n=1 Tax=Roseobacter insulae TaxID=2859783 RepID=A0A9X1FSP4_9RHOB|nr:flagellar biosynthetic protein FliR [Roseobacter insulae]MBW4706983.1 flagellar biosynthetic protein FliR [Roseobacter insulae]
MTAIAQLLPFLNEAIWHGFAVFLRVAALASLLPAFGEQSVPARIKLVVAMAFTVAVAPAVATVQAPEDLGDLVLLSLTEILAGLALGIGIRLFVLALQTAGTIAAHSTSLSQVFGGAGVDPMPAMGYVLIVGGLALAVMTGLHVKAAEMIILSYEFLPIGRFTDGSVLSEWGVAQVGRAFTLAFTLAAPFVILSVLYNVALGAINKAMPQLMVAFVGAPVITAGGLFLLLMASPLILSVWLDAMDGFLQNPFGPTR